MSTFPKSVPPDAVLRALHVGQRAFIKAIDEIMEKNGFDADENSEMRKTFLAAYSTGFLEGCDLLLQILQGKASSIIEGDETVN